MLKMHDYFPLEVKRALQSKDYRHLTLFDWENPGRKLFDDVTGKSLSWKDRSVIHFTSLFKH